MQPPNYFSRIEQEAQQNWELLESRPKLAAPWHQLFRQVTTSVRPVVSELLQNADDAGAKIASVRIENYDFIFEHDGIDFGFPSRNRGHLLVLEAFRGYDIRLFP